MEELAAWGVTIVPKPFAIDTLVAAVRGGLARRESSPERAGAAETVGPTERAADATTGPGHPPVE
jgi:DNA-binding response OmpR family regulator